MKRALFFTIIVIATLVHPTLGWAEDGLKKKPRDLERASTVRKPAVGPAYFWKMKNFRQMKLIRTLGRMKPARAAHFGQWRK